MQKWNNSVSRSEVIEVVEKEENDKIIERLCSKVFKKRMAWCQ